MRNEYVSWEQVNHNTQEIIRQMSAQNWKPDYVVGLTRGGLLPAMLISSYLDIPMETLRVSLRDHADTESNCWMAEDAFDGKNILIVDDISDSGETLNWIRDDWESGCRPGSDKWHTVWNDTVRVATLYDNQASESTIDVDYTANIINKIDDDVWVIFPWENWWK